MTTDRGALVILPVALGVGSVIPKYGVKPFLYLGTALATAGFPLLSTYTDLGQIEACLVVCVFGSGVLIACNPYSESTMVMIPNVPRCQIRYDLTIITERKRTLASAVTYRVTSTILLMILSYLIAGQLIESIAISVSFAVLATVLFYFNDRAWERTDWGRKRDDLNSDH